MSGCMRAMVHARGWEDNIYHAGPTDRTRTAHLVVTPLLSELSNQPI